MSCPYFCGIAENCRKIALSNVDPIINIVQKRDYKSREKTLCQSILKNKETEEKCKELKFYSMAKGILNKADKKGNDRFKGYLHFIDTMIQEWSDLSSIPSIT